MGKNKELEKLGGEILESSQDKATDLFDTTVWFVDDCLYQQMPEFVAAFNKIQSLFVKSNSIYNKELISNLISKANFSQDVNNMLNIALDIFDQNWRNAPEGFEGADQLSRLIRDRFI